MTSIFIITRHVKERKGSMGKQLFNLPGYYTSREAAAKDVQVLRQKNDNLVYSVEEHKPI